MGHNIENTLLISFLIVFIIFLVFRIDFIRDVIIPQTPPASQAVNSTTSGLVS